MRLLLAPQRRHLRFVRARLPGVRPRPGRLVMGNWMLAGRPRNAAEANARGMEGRRLDRAEIARVAAEMGLPVHPGRRTATPTRGPVDHPRKMRRP